MTINNCPVMTSFVRLADFLFSGKNIRFCEKTSIFGKVSRFWSHAKAISWKINPWICYFWNYLPEKAQIDEKPTILESVEFLFYWIIFLSKWWRCRWGSNFRSARWPIRRRDSAQHQNMAEPLAIVDLLLNFKLVRTWILSWLRLDERF